MQSGRVDDFDMDEPTVSLDAASVARLSPDDHAARIWAEAQARLSARARAGRAVNLDPAALVMDMLLDLAHLPPARSAPPAKG